MDKKIQKILQEIYLIDQSLKAEEDSLVKIISQLMKSKPEGKIDENFVNTLRFKLKAQSELLPNSGFKRHMFNFPIFRKIAMGVAAFAIILLIAFIGLKLNNDNVPIITENNQPSAIKDAGENAFGKIVFSTEEQINRGAGGTETSTQTPQALGMGGGGGVAKDSTGAGTSTIYPPYEYTNYQFVYKGGDFAVGDAKQEVYKRITDNSASYQLVNVINNMNLGPIDLGNFKNAKINSLEISEDREFGYSLYIDFRQNTFSINMNWEKWPNRDNFAAPSQQPSDNEIIAIADKFLSDYGIDVSQYGKGEVVNNNWVYIMKEGTGVADSASSEIAATSIRYSDAVSVVYPLMIDGKMVFDQNGQKYGISVAVDLGYKKVTSVYNINIKGFESSLYDVETDVNKIIKFAEAGGIYGNYGYYVYPEGTQKTIEVELGSPKSGLVIMWQYEEGKTGKELFVPSLLFPILSDLQQTNYYYGGNYIVVPLVGEMMENQNGTPRPLPLETQPSL